MSTVPTCTRDPNTCTLGFCDWPRCQPHDHPDETRARRRELARNETLHSLRDYSTGLLWIRFGKAGQLISQQVVDERVEFLAVGYIPKTDQVVLVLPTGTTTWGIVPLIAAEAEWSTGPAGGGKVWNRVGYSPKFGQLTVEDWE